MKTVWVVQYWMPPAKFLTFAGCYASEGAAIKWAWDNVLQPMHPDDYQQGIHFASDHFPGRREGRVVIPLKKGKEPRALALITEEKIHE